MNHSKARAEIAALRDAALEDLERTTPSQLRKETLEAGDDIGRIAEHVRSVMRGAAASAHRQRLVQARALMETKARAPIAGLVRPALEQIKQIIEGVFSEDPTLGLAFRDGKTQSESDWMSLYDDLVALGAIKPDDHER